MARHTDSMSVPEESCVLCLYNLGYVIERHEGNETMKVIDR